MFRKKNTPNHAPSWHKTARVLQYDNIVSELMECVMRKLKGSSGYLRNQTIKNLAKAALSLLIFLVILLALTLRVFSTLQVGLLEEVAAVLSLVPLGVFYFYLRKYRIYNGGLQGERQVAKLLTSSLGDEFFLINDLYLRNGGGDIDHIVLGPNGVFVLETKNWSGNITCNGDEWGRLGKRVFSSGPSRQVKRNAGKIKQVIDNSHVLGSGVWVEGIVVFTNKHATLHLNNPTVQVLKLPQLPNCLASYRGSRVYSRQELEVIGKEIIKQKH